MVLSYRNRIPVITPPDAKKAVYDPEQQPVGDNRLTHILRAARLEIASDPKPSAPSPFLIPGNGGNNNPGDHFPSVKIMASRDQNNINRFCSII